MLVAGFATFALMYCTQPLLPRFAAEFRVTPAAASLAVSLATGPLAVAILFAAVLADAVGHRRVMVASLAAAAGLTALTAAALIAGVALTAAAPLPIVIIGIGVVTAGFFGAHSVASSWVGRRAGGDRAQAAALYLFFYYLGSSVLGSAGRVAWSRGGWAGVA
jgi:MFS family permease